MVQGGEEPGMMGNHRVGETSLSNSGPSNQAPTYGIHGTKAAAANFFDHGRTGYFGELEEALMQGVDGIRSDGGGKDYFTTRLPTLEIFPSWPMRFQQNPRGNSQSAGSTDSGSAQVTISQLESESPVSRKAFSEKSAEQQQQQQGMMASDASRAGAAPNYQHGAQEKKRMGGSTTGKDTKMLDAKTLRRLAQNREAARKSRLRKKAYVQQLESSRIRLQQLEQELQRARSQGLFLGGGSASGDLSSGAAMFDMEYARWLDDNSKHMSELRGGLQAHLPDGNLAVIVDECIAHYDELFRLKGVAAKSDVFHLLTGMWATPAERCFLWMGGFKPSELLKILMPQLDPLTEQQLMGICNLQQSSQQAEEALSQGLEQLHQSLADTVAGGSLSDGADITNYMGHMAIALGKLANLEGFIQQADNLRQQTIHQMRRILTIRQAARCFLAIGEYYSRLRALSSFWSSRPQENLIPNESVCPTTTDLQIVHHPIHHHFSAF
ncbi:transcription factor TGAL5 [Phoenix dactylifera]|uniref:Transcription factor TGAL5 n=1 Tax=Phoenix dactylifera TaxID=42345 RepID=A0A8B8ZLJ3_PHODC|nr:transcription factor TGAL5 [Phoenix dactylifera]